jgi:heat shock protein HslJ
MKNSSFLVALMMLALALYSCSTAKHSRATNSTAAIGKYWKLVEIKGRPVQAGDWMKEPHLLLKKDERRISGNGGCNSFFGSYVLSAGNRIQFSQIGATKMACEHMELEQQFFEILDAAGYYTVRQDTLLLSDSTETPLARFVAVHGK